MLHPTAAAVCFSAFWFVYCVYQAKFSIIINKYTDILIIKWVQSAWTFIIQNEPGHIRLKRFFFITQCSAMRIGKDYNNYVYRSCGKQYCLDGMPEDELPKFAKKLFKQKYILDCCWSNVQHVQHPHITSTLPDKNARTLSSFTRTLVVRVTLRVRSV